MDSRVACRLLLWDLTMQIPYDLEFVENRPTVTARAVALREPLPLWRTEQPASEQDPLDALLAWIHRLIVRYESR